jgi:hypothetical protein
MLSNDINWVAIVVATIVSMVIGAVWYSPALFSKAWMEDTKKKDMDPTQGATAGYVVATIANLISGYVMARILATANAASIGEGLMVAFLLWLAFMAGPTLMNFMFEGRPMRLFNINAGMYLVSMLVMGAILAVWR